MNHPKELLCVAALWSLGALGCGGKLLAEPDGGLVYTSGGSDTGTDDGGVGDNGELEIASSSSSGSSGGSSPGSSSSSSSGGSKTGTTACGTSTCNNATQVCCAPTPNLGGGLGGILGGSRRRRRCGQRHVHGHRSVHGRDGLMHGHGQLFEGRRLLLLVRCGRTDRRRRRGWCGSGRRHGRSRRSRCGRQLHGGLRGWRLPALREDGRMSEGRYVHGVPHRGRKLLRGRRRRRARWPGRRRRRAGWPRGRRRGRARWSSWAARPVVEQPPRPAAPAADASRLRRRLVCHPRTRVRAGINDPASWAANSLVLCARACASRSRRSASAPSGSPGRMTLRTNTSAAL